MSDRYDGDDFDADPADFLAIHPAFGADEGGEAEAWTLGELHASADLGTLSAAGFAAEDRFA